MSAVPPSEAAASSDLPSDHDLRKMMRADGGRDPAAGFSRGWIVAAQDDMEGAPEGSGPTPPRHPWATRTECLIYLPTALAFGTVDYCEARPREVR